LSQPEAAGARVALALGRLHHEEAVGVRDCGVERLAGLDDLSGIEVRHVGASDRVVQRLGAARLVDGGGQGLTEDGGLGAEARGGRVGDIVGGDVEC
jgi:hypothetical protein